MNFKGKDCIIHVLQRLAGMDERLASEELVPLSLPRHHLQRAWSVAGIFYTGEVSVPRGG